MAKVNGRTSGTTCFSKTMLPGDWRDTSVGQAYGNAYSSRRVETSHKDDTSQKTMFVDHFTYRKQKWHYAQIVLRGGQTLNFTAPNDVRENHVQGKAYEFR